MIFEGADKWAHYRLNRLFAPAGVKVSGHIVYRNVCLPRLKVAHYSAGRAILPVEEACLADIKEQRFSQVLQLAKTPGVETGLSELAPRERAVRRCDEE